MNTADLMMKSKLKQILEMVIPDGTILIGSSGWRMNDPLHPRNQIWFGYWNGLVTDDETRQVERKQYVADLLNDVIDNPNKTIVLLEHTISNDPRKESKVMVEYE